MPEASGPIIEQTSTRVVYETPHMRLREDGIRRPDGSAGIYSYVEKPDFALIIPVENDGFHLVEQYRYPAQVAHPAILRPGTDANPAERGAMAESIRLVWNRAPGGRVRNLRWRA